MIVELLVFYASQARGGQPSHLISIADPPASVETHLAPTNNKQRWLAVGYGKVTRLIKELEHKHLSYMLVPWLTATSRIRMPEFLDPEWILLAIPSSQLSTAKTIYTDKQFVDNGFSLLPNPVAIFPPPTDTALIKQFKKERATFNIMKEMLISNKKVKMISPSRVEANGRGMESNQLQRFRTLLGISGTEIDAERVANGYEFQLWGFGSSQTEEYIKGIAYLNKRPAKLSGDLDTLVFDSRKTMVAYKPIEGKWYLVARFLP